MPKEKTQTAEVQGTSEQTQTPTETSPATDAGLKPFEQLAAELTVPDWALAGVRQQERYAEGQEVSEADFRAAVKAFLGQEVRN